MEKRRLRDYAVLYGAFLVYSASTVCAKFAARQDMMVKVLVFAALELVCLGVYALVWQQVLSRFPLVVAMANKGSVVLINLVWSVLLFGEHINGYNLAGAAIIIAGIWLVSGSRDGEETEEGR
jgi:drug/metabolite transporter (DMT)-like permease